MRPTPVLRRYLKQIAGYVRTRSASCFLEEIGRISSGVHDQLLLLKPKASAMTAVKELPDPPR